MDTNTYHCKYSKFKKDFMMKNDQIQKWGALLKQTAPGILPLFIFIIADEIWGTEIGLYVAICFGMIELVYTRIKDKRIDRFILVDILMLIILGLVSIILENDIFFKLKPGLIGIIFCCVLGISAYSPKNIILMMSKRYMKGISLDQKMEASMQIMVRWIFWIFVGHTLLVIYAAFYMSKKEWLFISGGMIYIIMGGFMLIILIKGFYNRYKSRHEEWVPLVDEKGNITGKATRRQCHQGPGLLHPVVHLHVINHKNEIFLQKRPMNKDVQPGKWDTAVGGHLSWGEDLETGLKREAFEEIGLTQFSCKPIGVYKWESTIESELVYSFITNNYDNLSINQNELDDGCFWTIPDIEKNIGKQVFTPNFEAEFKLLKALLLPPKKRKKSKKRY